MSEKRRDNKKRILMPNERQRADGMYEYRYVDSEGLKHSVYSWKLVSTDKLPAGKKPCEALRDMERQIEKDLEDEITPFLANRTTLNNFYDEYIDTKYELKQSTRTNYKYMYGKYVYDSLGKKKIADIKYSDVKRFYIHLIQDIGFKPNSVEIINNILHPVFSTAVRDGYIRRNPSDGIIAELKKSHAWEKPKRHALTIQQQEAFINFCHSSKQNEQWLPIFTILLGTGMRIGEFVGLRWEDCDFDKSLISINHNLIYRQQDVGNCEYHITTPKTSAGTRVIPMLSAVKDAFLQIYDEQKQTGFNMTVIDGYSGFILKNRYGDIMSPHSINRAIDRIVKEYNQYESLKSVEEHRKPVILPHFSVHNLRHTFCTRFCENETNIKVIQEIMGHADITTTMNIYNEATMDKKTESIENLEGKIKIC